MKKNHSSLATCLLKFLTLGLCIFLYPAFAQTRSQSIQHQLFIECYDDDSNPYVNQDHLPIAQYPNGPIKPIPLDCIDGAKPRVSANADGVAEIYWKGNKVFSSYAETPQWIKFSPLGYVSFLTSDGNLYLYHELSGLKRWASAFCGSVHDFKMSLDGKLMATLFDGSLLVDRNGAAALSSSMSKVRNLYSPRSADPIALMQSGEIISSEKRWYGVSSDPAVAVKVTVYGDLFWLTQEGRLWSYRRSSTAKRVVDQSVDPIVSFKINDRGNVAYVSAEGRLGRDGVWLIDRFVGIASYWIDATGHVSGKTNEGREFYY